MGRNLWNEIQKVINIHIEQIHFLPVSKAAILNVFFKENDDKKPMHNDDNIYRIFLLILSLSLFFARSLFNTQNILVSIAGTNCNQSEYDIVYIVFVYIVHCLYSNVCIAYRTLHSSMTTRSRTSNVSCLKVSEVTCKNTIS